MNQPNLQTILDNYGYKVTKTESKTVGFWKDVDSEAIDAIYAGLLAEVIGEDEPSTIVKEISDGVKLVQTHPANPIKEQQRQALKRWCYGDDK